MTQHHPHGDTLEHALKLIREGMYVFPCVPLGKAPNTAKGLYDASNDELDVKGFWEDCPNANIGLPTGEKNGFVVIDLDLGQDDGKEAFQSLATLDLSDTYTVKTGRGGFHFYYKYTPNIADLTNRTKWLPGLDFKTTGGYVIAPGSITEAPYIVSDSQPIAELPKDVADLIRKHQAVPTLDLAKTVDTIPEGGRHNYLVSVAGLLRDKGIPKQAATACLHEVNAIKCSPPVSDNEASSIVDRVYKLYQPEHAIPIETPQGQPEKTYVAASELITDMLDFLSDDAKVKGISTGFPGLDSLLGGGKRLGEICVTHAHAKTGKNALWHCQMHKLLERNIPIAYASRELNAASEVMPSLFSIHLQKNVRKMSKEEKQANESAFTDVAGKWPLYFSKGYGYFPEEELKPWILAMKALGVQYFWFDHLHYMIPNPEEHKEASSFIKQLKTLAKTENIHIDIIIQPNYLKEGQKLGLSTIKGGASIGQAIDSLLVLERVKDFDNQTKLTLDVARSPLARLGSTYFQYNPETNDFIETVKEREESPPQVYTEGAQKVHVYENGNGKSMKEKYRTSFGKLPGFSE